MHDLLKDHNKIIKEVISEKKKDPKVISILLFGSLARGTGHKDSDVDIEIIYDGGKYSDSSEKRNGIKVDFEVWPKKMLKDRIKQYPYLSYPYLEEKVLYDPQGFAKNIKKDLKVYFNKNPAALKEWKDWTKGYLEFKTRKIKRTNREKIVSCKEFYDGLELRFSSQRKITRKF